MATKSVKIKSTMRGSALLFTSAGGIRGGQVVSLPAAEATKLIGKGYAIKVIVRRKKKDISKNADTSDAGGSGNTGGKQSDAFTSDAQAPPVDGVGVEHTSSPPCSNSGDDPGVG